MNDCIQFPLPSGSRYWRGAGVDSVWEQEKLEARKLPERVFLKSIFAVLSYAEA